MQPDLHPLAPLAAAVLHVPAPERALEIGCGEGDGVLFLAREFPTARVRGLDPSEATIRQATSRIGLDPEGRVSFKRGSARSLPYPDDHFDLVVQRGGRLSVTEARRVLRSGGHLIQLDPLRRGWRRSRRRRGVRALRRRGFERVWSEEADGWTARVMRLAEGSAGSPE